MAIKESDDSTIDYEFLKKYIREDSDKSKESSQTNFSLNFVSQKQNSTGTEILSREGEGESYREESSNLNKKPWQKNRGFEEPLESNDSNENIVSKSPITDAKKEFKEHLEDESLTVDTASKLNFDWNNK